MLNRLIFFVVVFLILYPSCNEHSVTTVSVGHEINSESNGMMEATLDEKVEELRLKGKMELMDGRFVVHMVNPGEDTIYTRTFDAVFNNSVDTTFSPMPGKWIFRYRIEKVNDVKPSGNFQFSLIY